MVRFAQRRGEVEQIFGAVPQWPDVEALLKYIEDKPGARVGYGDLMTVLATDDPMRVLSATVILTGGSLPLLKPYVRVKSADGTLHSVAHIARVCLDGQAPYILEATGEAFDNVGDHAYIAFEVAQFTV